MTILRGYNWSTILFAALFVPLTISVAEPKDENTRLPDVEKILSTELSERNNAVGKYLHFQKTLTSELKDVLMLELDEGGKNDLKATACFLLVLTCISPRTLS